jgi:cytochrome c oxidase subunit 2
MMWRREPTALLIRGGGISGSLSPLPPQASTGRGEVDWLYFGLTAMMVFFCIVVFFPIITLRSVSAWLGRRSLVLLRETTCSRGGWTLFPLIISIGFFTWGAVVYYRIERPPRDALQVQLVAKQWMWKLQHAEGRKRSTSYTFR